MGDSLLEDYPFEFNLPCKKCQIIVNSIRDRDSEPRTSELYSIFNGKMSHRTVDKHVKELVTQGYLRRFVGNFSGEVSFLLLPDEIYLSMIKRDPQVKWKFIRNAPMFVSDCKILYENWREILTLQCPGCKTEKLVPVYEIISPEEKKYSDRRVIGEITWECDSCSFSHITLIRTL